MITIEQTQLIIQEGIRKGLLLDDVLYPPIKPTQFGGSYGAFDTAARYAGLSEAPCPHNHGTWIHGWVIPEYADDPASIFGGSAQFRENSKRSHVWTWRKDEQLALISQGYKYSKAIGAPICYVSPPKIDRIPGSVLIMPIHGDLSGKHKWPSNKMADYARHLKAKFPYVCACIYSMDIAVNNWIPDFRRAKVPIIPGALWCDTNALARMAFMFSQFEVVVSNGFGSHLLYAQLFGAKSCIDNSYGYHEHNYEEFESSYTHHQEKIKELYPFLFSTPEDASCNKEWARREAGWENVLPKNEIATEFGWSSLDISNYFKDHLTVSKDKWTYGRHLARLHMDKEANEYFNAARRMHGHSCVSGNFTYKYTEMLFGPLIAERIGEVLNRLK